MGSDQCPAGLLLGVLVENTSSRCISRWRAGWLDLRDARRIPPIELVDALLRDSPISEVCAHPERYIEAHVELRQLTGRRLVEVVVVIVRDKDGVERRQLRHCDRRTMESAADRDKAREPRVAQTRGQ